MKCNFQLYTLVLVAFFFFLFFDTAQCQPDTLVSVYSPLIEQIEPGQAFEAINLLNDQVAVVGKISPDKNTEYALLLLYNTKTHGIETKTWRGSTRCSLSGATRADNGHIFAVGQSDKQGLILEYDAEGTLLKIMRNTGATLQITSVGQSPNQTNARGKKAYGSGEIGQFEAFKKISWLKGTGSAVVAAESNSAATTTTLLRLQNDILTKRMVHNAGNLVQMLSTRNGRFVWLCGNTTVEEVVPNKKPKQTNLNKVWCLQIDSAFAKPEVVNIDKEDFNLIVSNASVSRGDGLYVVGEAYARPDYTHRARGWTGEIWKDQHFKGAQLLDPEEADTRATGICENALQETFTTFYLPGEKPQQGIERKFTGGSARQKWAVAPRSDWKVVKTLAISSEEVLIICNMALPNGQTGIGFYHLKKAEKKRPIMGGGPKPEFDSLHVPGGCLRLGLDNEAYVHIKNTGDEPLLDASLRVALADDADQIPLFVDFVPKKGGVFVSDGFGIRPPKNAAPGSSFPVLVSLIGKDGQSIYFDKRKVDLRVCLNNDPPVDALPPDSRSIVYQNILDGNKRVTNKSISVQQENYVLSGLVKDTGPVSKEKTLYSQNGKTVRLKDGMGGTAVISSQEVSDGFDTDFKIPITLEKGPNVIRLGILDENEPDGIYWFTDSLVLYYSKEEANMYVLAVAPDYTGSSDAVLDFIPKDARKFVEQMKAQEPLPIFNRVFIDTLIGLYAGGYEIQAKFDDFIKKGFTERDVIVICLIGHGSHLNEKSETGFCFHPARYQSKNHGVFCVDYGRWADSLANLPGKKIFIVDACHSGAAQKGQMGGGDEYEAATEALQQLNKIVKGSCSFFSSTGKQKSYGSDIWDHSLFMQAWLEALAGKPVELYQSDSGDTLDPDAGCPDLNFDDGRPIPNEANNRVLTACELERFLKRRVEDLVWEYNHWEHDLDHTQKASKKARTKRKDPKREKHAEQVPQLELTDGLNGIRPETRLFALPKK